MVVIAKLEYKFIFYTHSNGNLTMSENQKVEFNLADILTGMENRLSTQMKDLKVDIENVKDEIKDVKDDIKVDIENVKDDIKVNNENVKEEIKDVKDDIKVNNENVKDEIKDVKDEIKDVKDDIKDDIKDVKSDNNIRHDNHARQTERNIRELKSYLKFWLAALAGAGVIIGTIFAVVFWQWANQQNTRTNIIFEKFLNE